MAIALEKILYIMPNIVMSPMKIKSLLWQQLDDILFELGVHVLRDPSIIYTVYNHIRYIIPIHQQFFSDAIRTRSFYITQLRKSVVQFPSCQIDFQVLASCLGQNMDPHTASRYQKLPKSCVLTGVSLKSGLPKQCIYSWAICTPSTMTEPSS